MSPFPNPDPNLDTNPLTNPGPDPHPRGADRDWALVRDDVPAVQHPTEGAQLQASSRPVPAAAPEAGPPDGVGADRHFSHSGRLFQGWSPPHDPAI